MNSTDEIIAELESALKEWSDEHTPGPWRYTKRFGRYSIGEESGAMRLIATLDSSHSFDGRSLDADARLITASPDLLDALKSVSQTLAWNARGECRGFSDDLLPTNDALDKAKAAIEKATGETK